MFVSSVSQNLTSDSNDHHRERALPSCAPGNGDQISASAPNFAQSRDLSLSDNEDMANLIAACNNIESTNSGYVSHESKEEKTVDAVDAASLINYLEGTMNGLGSAEATLENPYPRPSYANGVSTEDNNFNESNDRREHRHELEASSSSSSSDNINVQSVENELKTSSDINILRSKTVPPCEKNMDKLQNEGTASVCDPNLDRRDPMEKTSLGDKVTFMAEHATISDVNASNDTNSITDEIASGKNNGDLKHDDKKNNTENQFQVAPVSKENTFLRDLSPKNNSQSANNNNQSETTLGSSLESEGSFYLSSSDEEDLFPTQSLEIDSLKEIPKLPPNTDEPVQRYHSQESTGNNDIRVRPLETSAIAGDTFYRDGPSKTPAVGGDTFQRDGPLETPAVGSDTFQTDGLSETSKVTFIVLSTGLSGVECQEDIDRFKTNMQMEKRVKNNELSDESKKCEGAKLDLTGSLSSLTESILSETSVKEVKEITEAVPQKQACEENLTQYDSDDFHSLHNTMGISNEQESAEVARDSAGGNSLHLSVNSFTASAYSESSEGFELGTLATDILEVVGSDVKSNNGSSEHVSEDNQTFERDIPTLEPPNTQTISIHSNIFSQNHGLDHIANILEPNQHSSENSSQAGMQDNNSTLSNVTASNITVLVTQAKRIIEMYFPEFCIRL